MAIDANDAVTDPRGASGPRTEAGKAKSSRNAIQYGLYAIHDYIREGEEEEYAGILTSIMAELSPEGSLEETFATQIMSAKWRLRRCGRVEFDLAENDLDPMADEKTEKIQRSVDRARTQSLNNFRRSIADLRKLQTERVIHTAIEATDIPGLTDIKHVLNTMKIHDKENAKEKAANHPKEKEPTADQTMETLEALMSLADKKLCQDLRNSDPGSFCKPAAASTPAASSFCKPAKSDLIPSELKAKTATRGQNVPRNAKCPCGSGKKYKRCHGNPVEPASPAGKMPTLSAQNPGNGTKPVVNKAA